MAFARDAITGFFADPREGKEIDYRGELEFDGYWYDFRFAGTVYFSEWDAPDGILLKIIDMLDTWIEMASTPKDGDEVPNDFEIRYFNALIKSYL